MDDDHLLKCITFDQDCFHDVRMLAADRRQSHWSTTCVPELSHASKGEIIYMRDKLPRSLHRDIVFKISDTDNDVLANVWINNVVLLGSTQDGLYLEKGFPVYDLDKPYVNETDVDILIEYGGIDILQDSNSEDCNATCYLCLEKTKKAGYFKFRICSPSLNAKPPVHFKASKLKHKLLIDLDLTHYFVCYNSLQIISNTPAIGGNIEDQLGIHDTDYVAALAMKQWPSVASSFISRSRPSGWPSPELLNTVTSNGCGFVATGHKQSEQTDYQWRISFAASEKLLIRSLSSPQIRAYLFFKSIFKLQLKTPEGLSSYMMQLKTPAGLSSYMMKNILFWTMETIEQSSWTDDNILFCVEALVDMLCACLDKGLISSFFLPSLNLLGHLDKGVIGRLASKARIIQDDVLSSVIKCTESTGFKGKCDISLALMRTKMSSENEQACSILSMVYFTMYLYLRLQVARYQFSLDVATLAESFANRCQSMSDAVAPRAVWYLLESIKVQPDSSLFEFDLQDKGQFVITVDGMRTKVVDFWRSPVYSGLFKQVVSDQERIINETVTQVPEFSEFLNWVDATCLWSGGKILNKDNIYFPVNLD